MIADIPHSTYEVSTSEIENDDNSHVKDKFIFKHEHTTGLIICGKVSNEKIEFKTILLRHQIYKQFDNLTNIRYHKFTDSWTYDQLKRLILYHSQENAKNHLASIVDSH